MEKTWNAEGKCFGQNYDETHVLDSSVLIMPLVFFIQTVSPLPLILMVIIGLIQSDPRFLGTLNRVLRMPDKGGLTSNVSFFLWLCSKFVLISFNLLVYRCNVEMSADTDGVLEEEGTISLCTSW